MAFTAFPILSTPATAARVAFTPAGTISATDVQSAIEEVAAEAVGGDPAEFVLNVVTDFGAVGDNVNDDTSAIQDAVDAALASAQLSGIRTIFFPPGRYKVTSAITIVTDSSVMLAFQGTAKTTIEANFAGFILDRSGGEANLEITIRDFFFRNVGGGCIRCVNTAFSHISDCQFTVGPAGVGIQQDNSNFNPCISNCKIRGVSLNASSTSIGIDYTTGGGGFISGVDIGGMSIGLLGGGCTGGRFEQNAIGIKNGGDIFSCGFEANNIAIQNGTGGVIAHCTILADNFSAYALTTTGDITSGSPIVTNIPSTANMYGGNDFAIDGVGIHADAEIATVDSATQITMTHNATATTAGLSFNYHTPSTHGINFTSGHNTLINVAGGGFYSVAFIGFTAQDPGNWSTEPGHRHTFINCRGANALAGKPIYVLPNDGTNTRPEGTLFIGCQPTPSVVCKFAQLPEGDFLVEGDERDIDNCNTAVWGATAAAGGSNHVKVRYNGTNWTVVGK